MAFTVVPLHNLYLPVGSRIPFGSGFVLQDVPHWVKKEGFLDFLSHREREGVKAAKQAFVAEYEADAIGELDPAWKVTSQNQFRIQRVRLLSSQA